MMTGEVIAVKTNLPSPSDFVSVRVNIFAPFEQGLLAKKRDVGFTVIFDLLYS